MEPDRQGNPTRPSARKSFPVAGWALVVLLFGLVERAALAAVYGPVSYGDTASYFRLAAVVAMRSLRGYDGTRVPGYPVLLALLRSEPAAVWKAQLGLGVAISLLLFWLMWRTTGSAPLAAGLGLLYDLIPGQFLFESTLLTETLSAFTVLLALALWAAFDRAAAAAIPAAGGEGRPQGGVGRLESAALAVAAGAAAAAAALVRPLFFLLPPWLLLFVAARPAGSLGRRVLHAAAFSLAPFVLLGGWIGFIDSSYGMLAPDVMGGFHLVQHSGAFFEYLPDDEAALRDTYLKYRDEQIAARGSQANAIWDAIPEMSEASGLGFYDLSRKLERLSIQLILEHPELYLRNVAEGWVGFWKGPVYWRPEAVDSPAARTVLAGWAVLGRGVTVAANGAFLLLALGALLSRRLRVALRVDRYAVAAAGLVLASSVAQTLVDHGDNPRFLVPLQMVVFYAVGRAAFYGWRSRSSA